jgi:ABC-type nickel/cobalt efflux system permease component RcnA
LCVRATALLLYLAFIAWHGVSQTMLGVSLTLPRFCRFRKVQSRQLEALILSELDTGEIQEGETEVLWSRPEIWLFFSLGAPQLASFFSGWLVYEIQIILLGKVPGVQPEALAAGVGSSYFIRRLTQTHTHTHTHSYTHTHTHTHTQMENLTHTHTHTHRRSG